MDKLGIEVPLLITQIINFSIMIFVLSKLLYKPILKSLDERKRKIQEGLEFAEKAKQQQELLNEKHEEVLKKAREEAKVIIENAKKDARGIKEDIIKEGHSEANILKEKLQKEYQVKEGELISQITKHTVDIALAMIKKLIPEILTDDERHGYIKSQLRKLHNSHAKQ